METVTKLPMTYFGKPVDLSADCFGELNSASDALDGREELHRRMTRDGYLFLPGLLDVDDAIAARRNVLEKLAKQGTLHEEAPLMEGRVRADAQELSFDASLAKDNPELHKLLYTGPMMRFYEHFLGGEIRHFDFTWFRVKTPGITNATPPHYDIVYMGRGTKNLYTSWTPLGDMPYGMGGLIVLENSHMQKQLRETYGQTDVDLYCENEGEAAEIVAHARAENRNLTPEERGQIRWNSTGNYSSDAIGVRAELGGRWLSAEFRMGDLLVMSMYTMHASLDNHTDTIRISSDSRYQRADEPADERWIGDDPPGHGIRAKRGMIC